jgi:transcriptional regulator with XRE-family HTH domain
VAADLSAPSLIALGRAVRTFRLARGLTQEGLAEAAGLHPRYVSDVERGRRNIGFLNLERLAHGLALELSALMAEFEAASRRPRGDASSGAGTEPS